MSGHYSQRLEEEDETFVPISYWLSKGHSEGYASAMMNLQKKLKKCAQSFGAISEKEPRGKFWYEVMPRRGRLFLLAEADHMVSWRDGGNHVLLHDDALLPSWRDFASSLIRADEESLCQISVFGIELNKEILQMLLPALRAKQLRCISLAENNIGSDGIHFLADLLERNSTLWKVLFGKNEFLDVNAVARLSGAINKHPCLKTLEIVGCDIGDVNDDILSLILNSAKNLRDLRINANELGCRGAIVISSFLETNPPLRDLSLGQNTFDDDDAFVFAQALKKNCNLRRICFDNNRLSEIGKTIFLNAVFDRSSLNAVGDSNHTCVIRIGIQHGESTDVQNPRRDLLHQKFCRREKILLALVGCREQFSLCHHVDLRYLENVPLNIMPFVLECLQQNLKTEVIQSRIVRNYLALTRLYQVLRGWEMPLLFEYGKGRNQLNQYH